MFSGLIINRRSFPRILDVRARVRGTTAILSFAPNCRATRSTRTLATLRKFLPAFDRFFRRGILLKFRRINSYLPRLIEAN